MDPTNWPTILEYSQRLDPDPPHAQQVCRLSLMIFDDLTILHGLSDETREMLKAASLLHDIGWSIPTMPHHKASRDIILKDTAMRLSSNERMIIAMIARYHRKSHPKPSHAIYKELCINDQMIVSWCAGIVRIADALDRAHQKQVKTVHCIVSPEDILISCTCTVTLHIDETVFSEKSKLLEELTNRRICLVCN